MSRKKYFSDRLDFRNNSIKSIWSTLNKICSYKVKNSGSGISHLTTSTGVLNDSLGMAKSFNSFFVNIGNNLSNQFQYSDDFLNYLKEPSSNSMFMTPTSINEVFNTIYSLKKSNSTGSDGLSTKVIQFAANAISAPLTYIVNKSFELGVFPNEFKCTKVF